MTSSLPPGADSSSDAKPDTGPTAGQGPDSDAPESIWPASKGFVLERRLKIYSRTTPLAQVAKATELSEYEVTIAAQKGAVWQQKSGHNKGKTKPRRVRALDDKVIPGTVILINYNSEVLAKIPLKPVLISDQGNYSIWHKPAGMLSQGSKWSDHCTVTRVIEKQHAKSSYLVHRLDRAASGLMIIAHTRNALAKLTEMFAGRAVNKFYSTVVQGNFDKTLPYIIETPIAEKSAITKVHKSDYTAANDTTTLEVQIETGRKHQIRQHLAEAGHPVVGDRLFDTENFHELDLQLQATRLEFKCPFAKKPLNFSVDTLDSGNDSAAD